MSLQVWISVLPYHYSLLPIHCLNQESYRAPDEQPDSLEAELMQMMEDEGFITSSPSLSHAPDQHLDDSVAPPKPDPPANEVTSGTSEAHDTEPTNVQINEHQNEESVPVPNEATRGTKRAHDDAATVEQLEPGAFSLFMDDDLYANSVPTGWILENACTASPGGREPPSETSPSGSGVANIHRQTNDASSKPDSATEDCRSHRQSISTIFEAMQWPSFHSERLLEHIAHRQPRKDECASDSESDDDLRAHEPIPGIKKLFKLFDSVPISTAFSGVDSPGTGLSQQVAELNYRITSRNLRRHHAGSFRRERKLGEPIHLNAIEWFVPSQNELKAHPSAPKCMFSDITHFQHACCRSMKHALDGTTTGRTREVLSQVFKNPNAIKLSEPQSYHVRVWAVQSFIFIYAFRN